METSGKLGIAAIIAFAAAAYAYSRSAGAYTQESSGYVPMYEGEYFGEWDTIAPIYIPSEEYQPVTESPFIPIPWVDLNTETFMPNNPESNLVAFLNVIGKYESGNDYNKLYGGGMFTDFSRHPNVKVSFFNPRTQKNDYSTAAGKYQINYPTYQDIAPKLGISDFSPASQDAIAIALLRITGAYDALMQGDIQTAFTLASKRWASLPGSTSMQHQISMQTAINAFNSYGGTTV